MKNIIEKAGLSCAVALLVSQHAVAGDSHTQDVQAQFAKVPAPISIGGEVQEHFGVLNVPDGSNPGNKCAYTKGFDSHGVPFAMVSELNDKLQVLDSEWPTASGCGYGTSSTPDEMPDHQFNISCEPNAVVNFAAQVITGSAAGVSVQETKSLPGVTVWNYAGPGGISGSTILDVVATGYSGQFTCMDDPRPAVQGGTAEINVAHTVIVDESASLTTDYISIGSLRLTADY